MEHLNDLVIHDDPPPQEDDRFNDIKPHNEDLDEDFELQEEDLLNPLDLSKPGNVMLFVGSQGKGKTNGVRYCLLKHSVDIKLYELILVFTQTKFDGEYDFVPDNMVIEGYQQPVLKAFLKTLSKQIDKKSGKKAPRNAIVFDDLIGLLNKHDKFLINFFGTIRHFSTDVYLPVQHLNTGSSTILRNITTHAFMFNSKQFNTIKSLYENYGLLFENINEFKKLFFEITGQPFVCMLYLQQEDDIAKNYIVTKFPDMSKFDGIQLKF